MGKKKRTKNPHLKQIQVFHKHEQNRLKSLPVPLVLSGHGHVTLQNFEGPTWSTSQCILYSSDVVFMFLQLASRETWQLKTHVFQDTSVFFNSGRGWHSKWYTKKQSGA